MTSLPAGWCWSSLNDLQADERRAITDGPFGSNLTSAHYSDSGARVIRLQNIGDGSFVDTKAFIPMAHFEQLKSHEARPGDLLVASLGEVVPRACLTPENLGPAIVKADCIRVRLGDRVDPRWALYSMQTPQVRSWAQAQLHGVGRPRLGLKAIRQLPVPLPPIGTQRHILGILEDHISRLDAAARDLDAAETRLGHLREKIVLHELFAADRVHDGARAPFPLPAGVDDGVLPGLPADWRWARLGEVAEVAGGVTKDSKRQSDPSFVEVPYLRVANVQRGRLDLSVITTIRVASGQALKLRLEPGDVLLNEGGDRDKLGRGWVWEGQIPNCIHQNHVFRARVLQGRIDPRLLSWAANSLGGRWCERNGKQSVNLASISMSKIRLMPVPVPPALAQPGIAARIEAAIDGTARLESELRSARLAVAGLRRSLLTAAFSGQLTSPSADSFRSEELASV